MKFNSNLLALENKNSFYKATERIKEYKASHPSNNVLSLGIGDVSFPIPKHVAMKMKEAIDVEASNDYVGYGNYYGLKELRQTIKEKEYPSFSEDEIYVSHGTKSDACDILEMFSDDILIALFSPLYPIYENGCNCLSKKYEIIDCDKNFLPLIPNKHYDVIYLCSPNNPIGIHYDFKTLKKWVEYANREQAVIIYDNVYYKFIKDGVKSIYDIPGAKSCAIELRSFSKHASFTGIRCSYYVIPNDLHNDINKYWRLRTINRFNGASYIAQIGALATFDQEAQEEINDHINYYLENATLLLKAFKELNYEVIGGENSPYLWVRCKNNMTSWEAFDFFLNKLEIVIVPGAIFGEKGEGYFRISALGKRKDIISAINRIKIYEENK